VPQTTQHGNATQESLTKIITNYFAGATPTRFELHAEELLSPTGSGPFAGHDRGRRNDLAKQVLKLLDDRSHDVHMLGIDKSKLASQNCDGNLAFDPTFRFFSPTII